MKVRNFTGLGILFAVIATSGHANPGNNSDDSAKVAPSGDGVSRRPDIKALVQRDQAEYQAILSGMKAEWDRQEAQQDSDRMSLVASGGDPKKRILLNAMRLYQQQEAARTEFLAKLDLLQEEYNRQKALDTVAIKDLMSHLNNL